MRYYTRRREIRKLRPGEKVDFRRGKGYFIVPALKPIPKPTPTPIPAVSPFAGKGLFTTSDADSASGHPCDWIALQMDPEGDESPLIANNPARLMYWQARPTADIVGVANAKGIPYIAQAESMPELEVALSCHLTVPKALVGNPSAWTPAGFAEAERQGWDLILEWYWNAQPTYTQPNAGGYQRFVNVCFGIYDASHEQANGTRVPLREYRNVWHGSFSCWCAEAMTDDDWQVFGAA